MKSITKLSNYLKMMKGIFLLSLISIIAAPKECLAEPVKGLDTGAVPQLVDQLLGSLLGGNLAGTPNGGLTAMTKCAETINDKHKVARVDIIKIIKKQKKAKCQLAVVEAHVNTLNDRIKETTRQLISVPEVKFMNGLEANKNDLKALTAQIQAAIGKLSKECQPKCIKIFVISNKLVTDINKILDNLKTVLQDTKTKSLLR